MGCRIGTCEWMIPPQREDLNVFLAPGGGEFAMRVQPRVRMSRVVGRGALTELIRAECDMERIRRNVASTRITAKGHFRMCRELREWIFLEKQPDVCAEDSDHDGISVVEMVAEEIATGPQFGL